MAEQDPRLTQLQKDIENEVNTSKSKYAFTGAGRSTANIEATTKVENEGVKLVRSLNSLILAEEALRSAQASGVSGDALDSISKWYASAQTNYNNLKTAQSKRLKQLSQDIVDVAGKLDLHLRYNALFGKFKRRPTGRNYVKVRPVAVKRTKTLSAQPSKQNVIPQRKIKAILSNKKRFGSRIFTGIKKQ